MKRPTELQPFKPIASPATFCTCFKRVLRNRSLVKPPHSALPQVTTLWPSATMATKAMLFETSSTTSCKEDATRALHPPWAAKPWDHNCAVSDLHLFLEPLNEFRTSDLPVSLYLILLPIFFCGLLITVPQNNNIDPKKKNVWRLVPSLPFHDGWILEKRSFETACFTLPNPRCSQSPNQLRPRCPTSPPCRLLSKHKRPRLWLSRPSPPLTDFGHSYSPEFGT